MIFTGDTMGYKKALATELEAITSSLKDAGYKVVKCQFTLTGKKTPLVVIEAESEIVLEEDN